MKTSLLLSLVAAAAMLVPSHAAPITLVPEKVPCAVPDKQSFQIPDHVVLDGWLGTRISNSEKNRLAKIDTERLLEGFRKRPGRQSWEGEHVGKWINAATLAWAYTGDPELRAKLDKTVAELCKCQEEDGYLGTYSTDGKPWPRWTEWDVWAHKYDLLGLVTYMRYTGNMEPLSVCQKIGDLLCNTFGDTPGKRDINTSGNHVGLASGSVMEPMVLLYRLTGEQRYLDFCNYLLRAWETPSGPHIISRLLDHQPVYKVGNGKAYEMLSCLNGIAELYRTTGDPKLLQASLNAWQDIVDHRLYITGTSSAGEIFRPDFELPNMAHIGETCVTVTWIQFNAQLLRLTGEARFAEQLEHTALNQLIGAQSPDCTSWGYYVQMEGKKPYSAELTGHCCLSSGPRGIALLPTFAYTTDKDGAVINLFETGKANLTLADGTPLALKIDTKYPADGLVHITVDPATKKEFAVKLRLPDWCKHHEITPSGWEKGTDGYLTLRKEWKPGEVIDLNLKLEPRLVMGDHMNEGKVAICYGPLVLAADDSLLAETNKSLPSFAIDKPELAALEVTPEPATGSFKTWPGAQLFRINAVTPANGQKYTTCLVPFGDAGSTLARYKVWLPIFGDPVANDILLRGVASASRQGKFPASAINDEDLTSNTETLDNTLAKEDWFAVTLDAPATISRIVFTPGNVFHDGGWFATKPQVQVQTEKDGPWKTIGQFDDYPMLSSTNFKDISGRLFNKKFTLTLPDPVKVVAIRVIGEPASGDNPKRNFSSCAELQAFEK